MYQVTLRYAFITHILGIAAMGRTMGLVMTFCVGRRHIDCSLRSTYLMNPLKPLSDPLGQCTDHIGVNIRLKWMKVIGLVPVYQIVIMRNYWYYIFPYHCIELLPDYASLMAGCHFPINYQLYWIRLCNWNIHHNSIYAIVLSCRDIYLENIK